MHCNVNFDVYPATVYPCNFINVLLVNLEPEQTTPFVLKSCVYRERVFFAARAALLSMNASKYK